MFPLIKTFAFFFFFLIHFFYFNESLGWINEVQRCNGFFKIFLFLFSTWGVGQVLGSVFHLIWSVETLPYEGCAFYSPCLQAVWDNSCLGTGLCKGYFGLTHRRCLPCAGGSGISEGSYCLPELVFLATDWAPQALHAVKQELWKFSFGNQTEVTSGAICVCLSFPAALLAVLWGRGIASLFL